MPDSLEQKLFIETCIDIALNAGHLLAEGKIAVADSREFAGRIQALAAEFENSGYDPEDYLQSVDSFSERLLTREYGQGPGTADTQDQHNEIYLLYACDQWKNRDSRRLVCACTDRETLYSAVVNEIYEGNMDFDGRAGSNGVARFREAYRGGHIDFGMLDYGYTDQVYNETFFVPGQARQRGQLYQALRMSDEAFERTMFAPPEAGRDQDMGIDDGMER